MTSPRLLLLPALVWIGSCHLVNDLDGYSFGPGTGDPVAISVEVEGLSTELSLELNGAETLVASSDGVLEFTTLVAFGAAYEVTFADPFGEHCVATPPSGTAEEAVTVRVACKPLVRPMYPELADWLDYVTPDGATECDLTGTRHTDCVNGGERRVVYVPGAEDCDDVSGSDTLDAFEWRCDDSGEHVELVSTGLRSTAGLSDLVDFNQQIFRDDAVEIQLADGRTVTTDPAVWWETPLVEAGAGEAFDRPGTIYLFVIDPGQPLTLDGVNHVAALVNPEVIASGALTVLGSDAVWVEGRFDTGFNVENTRFAVLRGIEYEGTATVTSTTATRITDVKADCVAGTGILAEHNTGLALEHARISGCETAIHVKDGSGGYLHDIQTANTEANGIIISDSSNGVAIDHVRCSSNDNQDAIFIDNSTAVHLTRILATSGMSSGVFFRDCITCSLRSATATSVSPGFSVLDSTDVWMSELIAANAQTGIELEGATNVMGGNWISASHHPGGSATAVQVENTSIAITGKLKVRDLEDGNVCNVIGTSSGINAITCRAEGAATYQLEDNIPYAAYFVLKVNDSVNQSDDDAGVAPFADDIDWFNFENESRVWGIGGTEILPDMHYQDACTEQSCQIFDWALLTIDVTAIEEYPTPTGDNFAIFDGEMFLLNAVEMLGDGRGDDDTFCEADERCIHQPNIGFYQGHGPLIPVSFQDGVLTGVELYRFENNGY